jgi:hypothetical protein
MDSLNFNSVETLPGYNARAAFTVNSSSVFKEDIVTVPIKYHIEVGAKYWESIFRAECRKIRD